MAALRPQQRDRLGVLTLTGLVPVSGAVDGEVADRAVLVEVHDEALAAVPLLAAVLPPFLELDQVAGVRGGHPLESDRAGLWVHLPAAGHERLGAVGLDPPVREGEVGEDRRSEQAVRSDPAGLEERHELVEAGPDGGRQRVGRGRHRAPAPAAARLCSTTAIVAPRASVGLNSTTVVPAVTRGRWPGA